MFNYKNFLNELGVRKADPVYRPVLFNPQHLRTPDEQGLHTYDTLTGSLNVEDVREKLEMYLAKLWFHIDVEDEDGPVALTLDLETNEFGPATKAENSILAESNKLEEVKELAGRYGLTWKDYFDPETIL